ncbi:LacI family transcriptional regulator [Arthrobacter sp. PGP41]|uniref:LacI family DNA-binding transcriptional regulator n=1 Tax=Arthrobacter sp. PGP41 TaxID=2079227 RepID=UPI000CDBAE51|nr:LacI family DNA-binding transcriptional regulator [Arthrobacter sp. PGP41]AUZ35070.1 LacI family transcriptional regulator [Arthrobacter sp. PGP41]
MAASTLTEVARLAGVSPATASRVLNGSARKPGQDIADRVRQAADSLGYIPNAQAQGLAKSSSGLIGLIVHDIADPYFAAIARGVQAAAREQRKMVLLATTGGAPAEEREAVAAFAARRADSIVIAGSRSSREEDRDDNADLAAELDRYCRNGGRVAVVGHPVVGATAPEGYHVVAVPNQELAGDLAAELAAGWVGNFVIIGGPEGLFTSDDRIRGFQEGLAKAGRGPAEILRTSFNRAGGYDAGIKLAARIKAERTPEGDGPGTAKMCIFAVNDVMAIGASAALRAEGLRVPRDARIAGFDDIETLRDFRPALSTVRLPLEDIGRLATRATAAGSGSSDGQEDEDPQPVRGEVTLRRSTEAVA